jgi:hypothetical protein
MHRAMLRARVSTAILLLALGGCGSGAIPTLVANPLPTAPASVAPRSGASPTIVAIESPPAGQLDSPTAASGQKWTRTITSTSVRHYHEGGANYMCSDAWTGTLATSQWHPFWATESSCRETPFASTRPCAVRRPSARRRVRSCG